MSDSIQFRLAELESKRAAYQRALREFDEVMKMAADLCDQDDREQDAIRHATERFRAVSDEYHAALKAYLARLRASGADSRSASHGRGKTGTTGGKR